MDQRSYAVEKFTSHRARIGVLGLGYAGLPLACTFAESGFETIGFDIDGLKVESLKKGQSYIAHLGANRTAELVRASKLIPTTDFTRLAECDAAIICVPTPLDLNHSPDLRYVTATATRIAAHLHPGQLVVLESTTYPGTTDEIVLPLLAKTGLTVGVDYFLAFSPEREDPANQSFSTKTIPKVVGGMTPACTAVATAAYGEVLDRVVPVSSTRVAEAAKLLENIYRCVNIAMINELKLLFERMGVNVWEVIGAASTKPFGFTPFYPGPGLGGHCIPIDPFYLTWKARQYDFVTRFIELAGEINTRMHEHVVEKLSEGLNLGGKALRGADVLILGVAYKPNVDDVRESPALAIIRLLDRKLARVRYHDPHVPVLQTRYLERRLASVELTPQAVAAADAVVIVTDHHAVDYSMVLDQAKLVIDSRNATVRYRNEHHNVILA